MSHRFFQVDSSTFLAVTTEHGPSAAAVWCYLIDRTGAKDRCWPSQATIASDLGLGIRTVQAALRKLAEAGVVELLRRGRGYLYRLGKMGQPVQPAEKQAQSTTVEGVPDATCADSAGEQAQKSRTNNTQGNNTQGVGIGDSCTLGSLREPLEGTLTLVRGANKGAPQQGSRAGSHEPMSQEPPESHQNAQEAKRDKRATEPAPDAAGDDRRAHSRRLPTLPSGIRNEDFWHAHALYEIWHTTKRLTMRLRDFLGLAVYARSKSRTPARLLQWLVTRGAVDRISAADEERARAAMDILVRDGILSESEFGREVAA